MQRQKSRTGPESGSNNSAGTNNDGGIGEKRRSCPGNKENCYCCENCSSPVGQYRKEKIPTNNLSDFIFLQIDNSNTRFTET